jgi:hypothetical protein
MARPSSPLTTRRAAGAQAGGSGLTIRRAPSKPRTRGGFKVPTQCPLPAPTS